MADPSTIAMLRRMYAQALMQPQIVPSAALQRPLVPRQAYPPGYVPSAQLPFPAAPQFAPPVDSLQMLGGTMPYIPGGSSVSPLMQQMLMQRLNQPLVDPLSSPYVGDGGYSPVPGYSPRPGWAR